MFVQFFKEKIAGSEISTLQNIGIDTLIFDEVKSPFFNPDIDKSRLRAEALKALAQMKDVFAREDYDLIVLDEFICLISEGVLAEEEAAGFLLAKPSGLELVLTGKGATQGIIDIADYVTDMKNIKHPYERNLGARKGIEF